MKKVMIVDDSLFQRKSLRKLIESLGWVVVAEAINGSEAVQLYPLFKPDIVFMDIVMPEMEGTEAIKEILKIDTLASIVVISSLGYDSLVNEALSLGAKHYITKPLDLASTISTLRDAFGGV